MPKQLKITVKESEASLKKMIRKTNTHLYKSRLKALLLVKTGKVLYKKDIAQKLGFSEQAIYQWFKLYDLKGIEGYLQVNFKGNAIKKISEELSQAIFKELNNPRTTITSYVELFALLKEQYQFDLPYTTLYDHCRIKYKSVLKTSRKSHHKKNEQAVEAFKKLQK